MIVTEEEAKTKRCQESYGDGWVTPDGRMATAAASVSAIVASPAFCIGSACMAWRWAADDDYKDGGFEDELKDPNFIAGYCGKAGRP